MIGVVDQNIIQEKISKNIDKESNARIFDTIFGLNYANIGIV